VLNGHTVIFAIKMLSPVLQLVITISAFGRVSANSVGCPTRVKDFLEESLGRGQKRYSKITKGLLLVLKDQF
jgi:hypothetical protein